MSSILTKLALMYMTGGMGGAAGGAAEAGTAASGAAATGAGAAAGASPSFFDSLKTGADSNLTDAAGNLGFNPETAGFLATNMGGASAGMGAGAQGLPQMPGYQPPPQMGSSAQQMYSSDRPTGFDSPPPIYSNLYKQFAMNRGGFA